MKDRHLLPMDELKPTVWVLKIEKSKILSSTTVSQPHTLTQALKFARKKLRNVNAMPNTNNDLLTTARRGRFPRRPRRLRLLVDFFAGISCCIPVVFPDFLVL